MYRIYFIVRFVRYVKIYTIHVRKYLLLDKQYRKKEISYAAYYFDIMICLLFRTMFVSFFSFSFPQTLRLICSNILVNLSFVLTSHLTNSWSFFITLNIQSAHCTINTKLEHRLLLVEHWWRWWMSDCAY